MKNKNVRTSQGDILDFLQTNTLVARLIKKPSSLNYRKMVLLGFFDGSFSLWETVMLMLPGRFALWHRYASRYFDFYDKKVREEIRGCLLEDGSVFVGGHIFVSQSVLELIGLVFQIILADQYQAKRFLGKDSIVIDAGANIGVFSVFAASIVSGGHVYAFEPTMGTFSLLLRNTQLYPSITCINQGLGDVISQKNILNKGAGNVGNVIEDSPYYKHSKNDKGNVEKITITTIDRFVTNNNIPHVDFIKIDTEGYEAKILKGAEKTIKKYKPVISMSAYHNPNDKKDLSMFVKSICEDYVCELHKEAEEDLICYVR